MDKKWRHICLVCLGMFLVAAWSSCTATNPGTLEIGCISILSGDVATYGSETRHGIDLALEDIDASEILGTNKISVKYEDSRIDAVVGTQAINKLINIDKVPAIIGPFSSRVMMAVAPIAEKNRVVLLSASATADDIRDAGKYIYRIVPPNKAQGTTAARFIYNQLGATKVAVYYVNDEYGVSLAREFKAAFEAVGGSTCFYEAFDPGQTDFRSSIEKIKATKPDAIYFPGQAGETGRILRQAKEIGLDKPFVGGDGSYSPDLITIAGDAAEGSYYTLMSMDYDSAKRRIEEFESRYSARFGEDATVYAAYAYDAMRVLANAISASKEFTGPAIKSALDNMDAYHGITGITDFDENGEVDKSFAVYQVVGGKFIIN